MKIPRERQQFEQYEIGFPFLSDLQPSKYHLFDDFSSQYPKQEPSTFHKDRVFSDQSCCFSVLIFEFEESKGKQQEELNSKMVQHQNQQKLVQKVEKSKQRRPKQRKNLYQFFKNEICYYLRILSNYRILSGQDANRTKKFQQKSCCLSNFSQLVKNPTIKNKIMQYFHSHDFIRRILLNQRLDFSRKIQVLKNLQLLDNLLQNAREKPSGRKLGRKSEKNNLRKPQSMQQLQYNEGK